MTELFPSVARLLEFGHLRWRFTNVKARAKPKAAEKPSTRRTAIARLVPSSEPNIDDEAEERQRAGVQSLGRAFAILGLVVDVRLARWNEPRDLCPPRRRLLGNFRLGARFHCDESPIFAAEL